MPEHLGHCFSYQSLMQTAREYCKVIHLSGSSLNSTVYFSSKYFHDYDLLEWVRIQLAFSYAFFSSLVGWLG